MGALTGRYPGETPIPHIYIFNTRTLEWEKGPAFPENRNRGAAGAVLYKDKFYVVCGIKDGHRGDHKNWLDEFDPNTGKWTQLADAPRARDHFQAAVANDKLYVLGGRLSMAPKKTFSETIKEVDVYDFKTGKWSTLEKGLPTERAGNYVALLGNEILVMGGESAAGQKAHGETEALNYNKHTWRSLRQMLDGRHGTGAIVYKNKIYVASGSSNRGGGPERTTQECFSF